MHLYTINVLIIDYIYTHTHTLSLSIYMYVCLSIYLSIYLYLSIYPSHRPALRWGQKVPLILGLGHATPLLVPPTVEPANVSDRVKTYATV